MKKLLSMLLAAAMLVSASAMAFAEGTSEKGTIVYGSSTEIGGDFAPSSWWTNNATDKMIRDLTNDYGVTVTNQGGEFVVNPTIAKNIESVVNPDGSKTFTVTINEGLTYNNGEEIKAADFLWAEVFSCSKVAMDTGAKLTGHLTYVGGKDYYEGTATAVSGIRLIDDYTFSVTILAEKIPYYYDLNYISLKPFSLKYWLGEGVELKDDGEGCYIAGDFTKEGIEKQLEYARFNAGEDRVSAGPYNLVAFDKGSLQATLTINPNYAGNFEGQKPSIEKIVVTKTEDATWADALKTGAFNFYDTVTDGNQINTALDIIAEGGFDYVQFDRAGYGMLNFQCDFGPTQFEAVRHAVALLLDRNEFANTFCQGWGGVVNGMYGTGLWQYQEAEEWLEMTLNPYSYDPEAAVEELKADGWVYNADGSDYVDGSGEIRYKKVTEVEAGTYAHNVTLADGTILMPLIIEWASAASGAAHNVLADYLSDNAEMQKAGMQIQQTEMPFSELRNWFCRDVSQGLHYGAKRYGIFNLAAALPTDYDRSYCYASDEESLAEGINENYISDDSLNTLSIRMTWAVEPGDREAYRQKWRDFIVRWNQVLPDLPLYVNTCCDAYSSKLKNWDADSFWGAPQALLYAWVEEPRRMALPLF